MGEGRACGMGEGRIALGETGAGWGAEEVGMCSADVDEDEDEAEEDDDGLSICASGFRLMGSPPMTRDAYRAALGTAELVDHAGFMSVVAVDEVGRVVVVEKKKEEKKTRRRGAAEAIGHESTIELRRPKGGFRARRSGLPPIDRWPSFDLFGLKGSRFTSFSRALSRISHSHATGQQHCKGDLQENGSKEWLKV